MVQVIPAEDRKLLQKLNQAYHTQAEHACLYVEKKEIKATLLYNLVRGEAQVVNISTVEEEIFDGLIRGFYELLSQQKVQRVRYLEQDHQEMLLQRGFVDNDGFAVQSVRAILANCENCKKQ